MLDGIISFFLLVGAFFLLVGSIGLYRLPDFYMRLHAPTKASTLGVGGALIAAMVAAVTDSLMLHELLITIFVFITAPISAHLVAQAALRLKVSSRAPETWHADNQTPADTDSRQHS